MAILRNAPRPPRVGARTRDQAGHRSPKSSDWSLTPGGCWQGFSCFAASVPGVGVGVGDRGRSLLSLRSCGKSKRATESKVPGPACPCGYPGGA